MSAKPKNPDIITDAEYAMIRKRLPIKMAAFFDGLRASGRRLVEASGGNPQPCVRSWHTAMEAAMKDGLTRPVSIHELRLDVITKLRKP